LRLRDPSVLEVLSILLQALSVLQFPFRLADQSDLLRPEDLSALSRQ
jgi:hypothetical protein